MFSYSSVLDVSTKRKTASVCSLIAHLISFFAFVEISFLKKGKPENHSRNIRKQSHVNTPILQSLAPNLKT